MTLSDMKLYLRVDHTSDDTLITSLTTAAGAYIDKQTGKTEVKTGVDSEGVAVYEVISSSELYSLAVKLLVSHWYENRGIEISGNMTKITHSVDALIQHISMCGDYI